MAIYARGEALKSRCDRLLREAEAKIETIALSAGGQPSGTRPLDME
jgi:exodeoxyribonuclease VII small subunit